MGRGSEPGASYWLFGARILVTLLSVMEKDDLKKGCASLCIGGGEGVAMIIERA